MEGLALTGAWVDKEKGLLSMIALEMGVSSRLFAYLKPGEPVVVMGPTGTPTEIPHGENVLLAGGGLGNAVLFSIAKALQGRTATAWSTSPATGRARTCTSARRSSRPPIRWSGAPTSATPITPARPQDTHFSGNIVQAMVAYANGELGETRCRCRACRASSPSARIA